MASRDRLVHYDNDYASYVEKVKRMDMYTSSTNPGGPNTFWQRKDGILFRGSVNMEIGGGGGSGDVVGPGPVTPTAVALFDDNTGLLLGESQVTHSASGLIANVIGVELIPVASNPGNANTIWVDSATGELQVGALNIVELNTRVTELEDLIRRGAPGEVEVNGSITVGVTF